MPPRAARRRRTRPVTRTGCGPSEKGGKACRHLSLKRGEGGTEAVHGVGDIHNSLTHVADLLAQGLEVVVELGLVLVEILGLCADKLSHLSEFVLEHLWRLGLLRLLLLLLLRLLLYWLMVKRLLQQVLLRLLLLLLLLLYPLLLV